MRNLNEKTCASKLLKPEAYLRRSRPGTRLKITGFDKTLDHRPVLVALRILGFHEIRQRQYITRGPIRHLDRGPAPPQLRKWIDAPHNGHDVHPHPRSVRVMASEMNGVAAFQVLQCERWDGNLGGLKVGKSTEKPCKICGIRQKRKVRVAAKLPLRRTIRTPALP